MSLFDMLEEVQSETLVLKHPFYDRDIEFRMAYASALSMAAHAEGSLDPDKSTKLKGVFTSLGLKDQSEKFLELGAKPDKAVLLSSLGALNETLPKVHFLLELDALNYADLELSTSEKKAFDQFEKILKLGHQEDKMISQFSSLHTGIKNIPNWLQETQKIFEDLPSLAQLVCYWQDKDVEKVLDEKFMIAEAKEKLANFKAHSSVDIQAPDYIKGNDLYCYLTKTTSLIFGGTPDERDPFYIEIENSGLYWASSVIYSTDDRFLSIQKMILDSKREDLQQFIVHDSHWLSLDERRALRNLIKGDAVELYGVRELKQAFENRYIS